MSFIGRMVNSGKRATIATLGCRLNQAEARLIEDQLCAAGYVLAGADDRVDVAIVQTCVVTGEAEAKSRKLIRRLTRQHPDATVVVIGCYAQTNAESIAAMDGVHLVLDNNAKMDLPALLAILDPAAPTIACQPLGSDMFTLPFLADGPPITRRANLKIQDGCDGQCAYCYVRIARGPSRSRRFDDAVAEAAALVKRGARELVLTGVNVGSYQDDDRQIPQLCDALDALRPKPRVRISSIELNTIPETLLPRMADPDHALAPHLHIPLQSGSKSVLRAMGRPYAPEDYQSFITTVANLLPDIGLGADVMVGFPGETDADFEATCALVEQSPLTYLHVFQYSDRPQVAAAQLPDKIPAAVIKARSKTLRALGRRKHRTFQQRWLGHDVTVLFESKRDDFWIGHTGNYLEVGVRSDAPLSNRFATVKIKDISGTRLLGDIVSKPA